MYLCSIYEISSTKRINITQKYKYTKNIFHFYIGACATDDDCDGSSAVCKGDSTCGACAADTDCDGDPICKTDNTCGKYIYIYYILWEILYEKEKKTFIGHKYK